MDNESIVKRYEPELTIFTKALGDRLAENDHKRKWTESDRYGLELAANRNLRTATACLSLLDANQLSPDDVSALTYRGVNPKNVDEVAALASRSLLDVAAYTMMLHDLVLRKQYTQQGDHSQIPDDCKQEAQDDISF